MADDDPLLDDHRVIRACHYNYKKAKVRPAAFKLSERDEGRLSTGWVECSSVPPSEQTVEATADRMGRYLKPQKGAVLRVRLVRGIVIGNNGLDVIEDTHAGSMPCHASILGMPGDHTELTFRQKPAALANAGEMVDITSR